MKGLTTETLAIAAIIVIGFLPLEICSRQAGSTASISVNSAYVCSNSSISIRADEPVDHDDICKSAEDALAFFDRLKIELTHPLVVEVVLNLEYWSSGTTVGCYQEEEKKVCVLTFPEFEKRETWFGVPADRLMYRSIVTHEVAHAVARCNFTISDPTIHAEEYVAYVTMFVMMHPDLRERVLVKNSEARFDNESEINEIIYALDPMRFGVAAYRHYLEEEHGDSFLLKTLSGNVLTNSLDDWPMR